MNKQIELPQWKLDQQETKQKLKATKVLSAGKKVTNDLGIRKTKRQLRAASKPHVDIQAYKSGAWGEGKR